jgi:glycosyltransferase involved in cell wall biosynthesis
MKTILIAHNYSENSFASMSFSLAHHLAKLGNRIVFISHKPFFKDMKIIKKGKGEVILFSWPSEKRPTSFKDVFWFVKIYLKYKPQVVIGHFVGSNITIAISKLLSFGKTRTFGYYHTLSEQISSDQKKTLRKQKILFYRKRIFYKAFCDVIICPSILAKKDLESFYSFKKGIVLLNPMVDRFESKKVKDDDEIFVSYLGRLDPSKGLVDLINAFKIYKANFQNSKIILNIAGSGGLEKEIKKLMHNVPSILFFGGLEYDKVDDYLNRSHFTIIPSKIDNLPTVGIESLMNKTPLLISNSTGLTNYLVDGKECFKFNPNIDSIVALLENVESNFNMHEQMCKDARSTFLNLFSMDNYCNEFSKMLL